MRLTDAKTLDDVAKYIKYKWDKQGLYTLEVQQIENRVFITYGKLITPETEKELAPWHKLLLSTKINQKPLLKNIHARINLCNFIEPYKSQKQKYDKKREEMMRGDEVKDKVK